MVRGIFYGVTADMRIHPDAQKCVVFFGLHGLGARFDTLAPDSLLVDERKAILPARALSAAHEANRPAIFFNRDTIDGAIASALSHTAISVSIIFAKEASPSPSYLPFSPEITVV
jgi:hypothetical protein